MLVAMLTFAPNASRASLSMDIHIIFLTMYTKLIVWTSIYRNLCLRQNTEAEYLALAVCAKYVIWLQHLLLSELGCKQVRQK